MTPIAGDDRKGSNRTTLLCPKHPERVCWGCDRYCPPKDLACREERVPHPIEPFGYSPESTDLQPVRDVTSPLSKESAPCARERR